MNDTIIKFGYPESLIKEYKHWVVLVRPAQVTLGSLIVACKEDALALGEVSTSAWTEYGQVIHELESVLKKCFRYQKINYLALMMKDKHVHFHVIPRYSLTRKYLNLNWSDKDWPQKTELDSTRILNGKEMKMMVNKISDGWSKQETMTENAKLYSDGGSRGNPGPSAGAFVICKMDDNVVEKSGFYIGTATNNQAEYQALLQGLQRTQALGVRKLNVFMDSELVVKQLSGLYKIKNKGLEPLYRQVKKLADGFEDISFIHVPRALNKEADTEVNRILDEKARAI